MYVEAPALSPALIQAMNKRWGFLSSPWPLLPRLVKDGLVVEVLASLPDDIIHFGSSDKITEGLDFFDRLDQEERRGLEKVCVSEGITHGRWDALLTHSTHFYQSRSHSLIHVFRCSTSAFCKTTWTSGSPCTATVLPMPSAPTDTLMTFHFQSFFGS
jgi:hypothetical protein